jgi:drug/metabolite transporter (DMT)-like permease
LLPGLTAPDPLGAAMMAAAGVAWGVYSLRGRGMQRPVTATMENFAWAAPLALIAWLAYAGLTGASASARGVALAAASGSVASGMGYALWYTALRGLTATSASAVQLTVPVIAAVGGIVLLGEKPTLRLGLASILILGGVGLTILSKRRA